MQLEEEKLNLANNGPKGCDDPFAPALYTSLLATKLINTASLQCWPGEGGGSRIRVTALRGWGFVIKKRKLKKDDVPGDLRRSIVDRRRMVASSVVSFAAAQSPSVACVAIVSSGLHGAYVASWMIREMRDRALPKMMASAISWSSLSSSACVDPTRRK